MDLKKVRPSALGNTHPKPSEADELARLTLDSNQLGQSYTKLPPRQDYRRRRERTSSNKSGQRSPQIVKGARLPLAEHDSTRNLMDSSSNRQSDQNFSQLLRTQFELDEPHRRSSKKHRNSRGNTPTDEGHIDDRIEIVDFGAGSPQYQKKPESLDILPRRASKRHTGNLQNHLATSKDRDHLPEIVPVMDVDLEHLQNEQTQINDELRMLKEVQKTRKERLQLIKEQSIGEMEQELKDLKKIDKKKRQVPRVGTISKIFFETKKNSFNEGKDRPASSRITTQDENKDLSLIHAIDKRKKQKNKAKQRISDLQNTLKAPISNFGYMTAYNPRTKENESSRSSMSSANPMGDIGSIEGEVPVDVEQELSKRMQKEKELSEDDDDLDASTPQPKKRKNRPLHMQMSDDSSDSETPISRTRARASSQLSGLPRKVKDGENKLRDVRQSMINGSFGPMSPDVTPKTDEKDERKRKRRGSQAHMSSELNVDQIMKNMSPDEKNGVTRKGSKEESGLKSKLSYKKTFGQSINDDVLQTDALPRIDESKIKAKDKMKVERMRARKNKKTWMLYPEDQQKVYWDLFITVILLISCILTPYNIAFGEVKEPIGWTIINFTIDAMFLIDIMIIFNSAYYDDEFIIVEDRKQIASEYIASWFIIDLLAIVPFDYIFVSDNYQEIVRIARIGKISKLIKMTRLLRILKIVKQRSQLLKYLNEILKIGLGLERLLFFTLIFFLMCHILTCIWVIAAQFSQEEVEGEEAALVDPEASARRLLNETAALTNSTSEEETKSWFDEFSHLNTGSAYITSFYFTITTITTVGYGDISGTNTLERSVSILIMIIGVISFSFTTGSLSSILQNYDQANAKLQERISVLNRIYKEYYLPLDLYQRLRQAVKYDFNKDKNDINQFVVDLPHKLKLEISLYIHEQTYKKIDIFKGRSSAFIAWICPLLKPLPFPENQYIYFEGDDITNIYFLIRGKAGFVLPKYQNTAFIDINVGSHFGIIDIVGSILQAKFDLENWILHKDVLQRQFTIMALKESEVMCLSVQDLNRMKQEFLEAYQKLFGDAYNRLRRSLTLKLKAMKICAEREESSQFSQKSDDGSVEFDVNQQAPQSLSNEISLTQEERRQIKAHEIDYQIQAIQLNKIDEQSLEESSQGRTATPIKSNRGQVGLNSSKKELEDEPPSGPTQPLLPAPPAAVSKVSEEEGANDFFADAQKAYNEENDSFKEAVKRRRSMHYNSRQDLNRDVDSQLIKQDANSPGLKKIAKTDDELSKSLSGLQAKKSRLQQDFDIHNLKIIQKAKEDHIVELESKEIIKQVTALQKGLSFGFSPDSKPQAAPSTSQGSLGSYNFLRNRGSPPKEEHVPVGEGIAPVATAELGEVTQMLTLILRKVETLEETQKQTVSQMKSHIQDLEKKVEQTMLKPSKKKSRTHADSSLPRGSSFKQEKGKASPTKEEPDGRRRGSDLLADTPKDRSPAKTHKDLGGTPSKELKKQKSRKQSSRFANPSELNLQMSNDGSKIENIFGELSTKKNGHPHPKMSSNFEDKHVEKLFKESSVGRKHSKAGVIGAVYESPNSQTRVKDFVGFLNSKSSGHSSPHPPDKDKQ